MGDSLVHAAAGSLGGELPQPSSSNGHPLINISTRAQVETKKHPNQGTRAAILKVLNQEGIWGLYDGLSSSLLGIAVTNGCVYISHCLHFEESRSALLRLKNTKSPSLTTLESMLAGAIAGSATSIISNPIWVVNTRQTVRTTLQGNAAEGEKRVVTKKLSFAQTVLHILNTDGWKAFFHGLGPALVLVINPIIQYTLFEQLKNVLLSRKPKLTDIDYFYLGALSKLIATGLTYPYLTIKSRQQANIPNSKQHRSSLHALRAIVDEEGVEGLYRGIGPKLFQSVLTAAFLFMSKERIYAITKDVLEKRKRVVA
ncbi:mitochondrial carrier [Atractiella rhizophila]|nr:mitochondrial carrier [Atractiella rhizophila]